MNSFCLTNNIRHKIHDIKLCADSGIPVLLIGKTGTGKTAAAIEAMKNHNNNPEPVRFNFSSETQPHHLLGHIAFDSELSFIYGKYADAYKNGKAIILDELNLASDEVLHCIEASLDSGFLTIDNTQGIERIAMHKKFVLIATENPPYDNFISKRNILTNKFKSKFKIIEFQDFEKDELMIIAKQTGKGFMVPNKVLDNFISFHIDISSSTSSDRPFTIRDLKAVLCSFNSSEGIDIAIYRQYRSYNPKLCEEKMTKYGFAPKFINDPKYDEIWYKIVPPEIFKNISIQHVVKIAERLINQKLPILIIGEAGCGKTFAAKLISKLVTEEDPALILCNPETAIADLIGNYVAVERSDEKIPIEWYDSQMVKALSEGNGRPVILDQIDMISAQIIERLNPLLDSFSNEEFEISESSEPRILKIKDNFRIIATATLDNLNQISPALLNRFTIIFMDNQLKDLDDADIYNLLKTASLNREFSQVYQTIDELKAINLFKDYSISAVLKLFNSTKIIMDKYSISPESTLEYMTEILIKQKIPNFPENVVKSLLAKYSDSSDFFYKSIPSITNLICVLQILRDIGQPVVLQSTTGLGKTSCAMAFAEMNNNKNQKAKKLSFNKETRISDLYGSLTVRNGKIGNNKGPLLEALQDGLVFVADELNLAESTIIESLVTALEGRNISCCIPTVTNPVNINQEFFFIGCQNDSSMFGRKHLPNSLLRKVTVLEYPYPKGPELLDLLEKIVSNEGFHHLDSVKIVSNFVARIIDSISTSPIFKYHPWSFREVRKFVKRIYFTYNSKDIVIPPNRVLEVQAALMLKSSADISEATIKEIIDIITRGNTFNASRELSEDLSNILRDDVVVRKNRTSTTISKGKVTITIQKESKVSKKIKTFWNAVFDIMMMPPNEPLLIYGESGFKTFLAEFISTNPGVVPLNRDTATSELIGQVSLVDSKSYRANLFHILMTMSPADIAYKFKKMSESINEIDLNELDNLTNSLIEIIPFLQNVINQIKMNIHLSNQREAKSIMKDHTTMFIPGLITRHIFQKRTTILKNFNAPAVAVIERLNELLANEPELTLNEDYTTTIVPQENRTINIRNDSNEFKYRVIAICHENDIRQLSEAMRSRLTMVHVNPYTKSEIEIIHPILSAICETNNDNINFAQLNLIKKLSDDFHKYSSDMSLEESMKAARDITLGLSRIKCDEESMTTNPLIVEESKVVSKFYKPISYPMISKIPNSFIVFTPLMQKLVQAAFVAAFTNTPLIMQGPNGGGKSTAIVYALSTIGIKESEVKFIQLSKSTTVENLFGSNGVKQTSSGTTFEFIPTDFVKAITNSAETSNYKAVIITELNLAPAPVLDSLLPLFSYENMEQILLPNGETRSKNSKCRIFGLASMPFTSQDIRKKTMFLETEEYSDAEFKEICHKYIEDYNLTHSENQRLDSIPDILTKLRRFGLHKHQEYTVTVRHLQTFLRLNQYISFNSLLKTIIEGIFSDKSIAKEIIGLTKYEKRNEYSYNSFTRTLSIQGQSVKVKDPNVCQSMLERIDTLTDDQMKLFEFLASNCSHRFPIIAEGPTASGKTHAITLFADLVGIPLTVLQLNSESSISLVMGGVNISPYISQNNRVKIYNIISSEPNLRRLFSNIINDEKWKIIDLKNIQKKIEMMKGIRRLNESISKKLLETINDSCQVINAVESTQSPILSAMREGSWVLLDNVEAAPGDIIDRITPLLCENPDYGIFGDERIRDKVHPNFRILMTYNPYGVHRLTSLSNTIRSRCFVFSMNPIDESILSTGLILKSIAPKLDPKTAYQIARVHMNNKNNASEIDEITGRTLLRIGKVIRKQKGDINDDYITKLLTFVYSKGLIFDASPSIIKIYLEEIKQEDLDEFKQMTKSKSESSKEITEYLQQTIDGRLFDFHTFVNLLQKASFSSMSNIMILLRSYIDSIMREDNIDEQKNFVVEVLHYVLDYVNKLWRYYKENHIPDDTTLRSEQCLEHKEIIDINVRLSKLLREIDVSPMTLRGNYQSQIAEALPLLALLQDSTWILGLGDIFSEFYELFTNAFEENSLIDLESLRDFYHTFRRLSIKYHENRPKQLVNKLDIEEVRSIYHIDFKLKKNKSFSRVWNFVSLIKERINKEKQKARNLSINEESLINIDIIYDIVQSKQENWQLFESIKKVIDANKDIKLNNYAFENMRKQIEKYSPKKSEINLFKELHNNFGDGKSSMWFQIILDFSFVESLSDLITNEETCFYAIAALPENCCKEEAVKYVLYNNVGNNELSTKIKARNKSIFMHNLLSEFEERESVLSYNTFVENINELLETNYKIDSTWYKIIQNNEIIPLETQIIIPQIDLTDITNLVKEVYPGRVKETSTNIDDIIDALGGIEDSNNLIEFIKKLTTSFEKDKLTLDNLDLISFENDMTTFFDKCYQEAIVLFKNNQIASILESTFKSQKITFGIILLRVYACRSKIEFTTNDKRVSKEAAEYMTFSFNSVIKDCKNVPYSIIYPMMVEDDFGKISKMGSLLHDSFVQVLSICEWSVVYEFLPDFLLNQIIMEIIKDPEMTKFQNNFYSCNFIFSPVLFFNDYASKHLKYLRNNKGNKLKNNVNSALKSINNAVNRLYVASEYDTKFSFYSTHPNRSRSDVLNLYYKMSAGIKYLSTVLPQVKMANKRLSIEHQDYAIEVMDVLRRLGKSSHRDSIANNQVKLNFLFITNQNNVTLNIEGNALILCNPGKDPAVAFISFDVNDPTMTQNCEGIELISVSVDEESYPQESFRGIKEVVSVSNLFLKRYSDKLFSVKPNEREPYEIFIGNQKVKEFINSLKEQSTFQDMFNLTNNNQKIAFCSHQKNPEHTCEAFQELVSLLETSVPIEKEYATILEKCRKLPDSIQISKSFKFTPPTEFHPNINNSNIKIEYKSNIKIEFPAKKKLRLSSSPVITAINGNIKIAFNQINATLSNVPRGVLSGPAKIRLFVIGYLPEIKTIPENPLYTVQIEYNKSDMMYLLIQTSTLTEDAIFSGTVLIGNAKFRYNIDVHLIDPIIVLSSPGNYFISDKSNFALSPNSFINEKTLLNAYIIGYKELPIQMKAKKVNKEGKNDKIDVQESNNGVSIKYGNIQNHNVLINLSITPKIKIPIYTKCDLVNRPILCRVFHNEKNKFIDTKIRDPIDVGTALIPLYIFIGTMIRTEEKLSITCESKHLNIYEWKGKIKFQYTNGNTYAVLYKIPIKLKQEYSYHFIQKSMKIVVHIPNSDDYEFRVSFSNEKGFFIKKDEEHTFGVKKPKILYYSSFSNSWIDQRPQNQTEFNIAISSTSYSFYYKFWQYGSYLEYRTPEIINLDKLSGEFKGIYIRPDGLLYVSKYGNAGDSLIIGVVGNKNQKNKNIVNWFPGRKDDVEQAFNIFDRNPDKFNAFVRQLLGMNVIMDIKNSKEAVNILKGQFDERRDKITYKQAGFLNFPINIKDIVFKKIKELQKEKYKKPQKDQFDELVNQTEKEIRELTAFAVYNNEKNYIVYEKGVISIKDKKFISSLNSNEKMKFNGSFVQNEFKEEQFEYKKPVLESLVRKNNPLNFTEYLENFTDQCMKLSLFLNSSTSFKNCNLDNIINDLSRLYEWCNANKDYGFVTPIRKFVLSMKMLIQNLSQCGIRAPKLEEINRRNFENFEPFEPPKFEPPKIDHIQEKPKEQKQIKIPAFNEIIKKEEDKPKNPTLEFPIYQKKEAKVLPKKKLEGYSVIDISQIAMLTDWIVEQISNGTPIRDADQEVVDIGKPVIGEAKGEFCFKEFVTSAKPLAATIFKNMYNQACNAKNSEVILMMDISSSNRRLRHIILTATIAHAMALSSLKVRFSIVSFSDHYFHVMIKDFNEELQPKHIQLLFDSMKAVRRVTFLSSAIRFVNSELNQDFDHHFIVLSDGLFLDMYEDEWKDILLQNSTIDCLAFPDIPEKQAAEVEKRASIFSNSMKGKVLFHFVKQPINVFTGSNDLAIACSRINSSKPLIPARILNPIMPSKVIIENTSTVTLSGDSRNESIFVKCGEDLPYVSEIHPSVTLEKTHSYVTTVEGEKANFSSFDPLRKKSGVVSSLYAPNRPTQYVPSEKGSTLIYMIGLIKSCITHGQEKKIYLEKKSGYIPSYSTFIVVDCSTSCFPIFSDDDRSSEMVLSFMHLIADLESHMVTVIVSTANGPVVLCKDKRSNEVLQSNSDLFTTVLGAMSRPSSKTSFADAMEVVRELRTRQTTSASYVFAFTDGNMSNPEIKRTQSLLAALEVLSAEVIGIGIGLDPNPAKNIFKKFVWSKYAINLPDCIQKLAQEQNILCDIDAVSVEPVSPEIVNQLPTLLETRSPVFIDFIEYIRNLSVSMTSTMVMYNQNVVKNGQLIGMTNQNVAKQRQEKVMNDVMASSKYDLGKENIYKFRILFCLFYDSSMNRNENGEISYNNLCGQNGIFKEMKDLGITVDVVLNYREAIAGLSLGIYTQAWIVCGKGDKIKPAQNVRPQMQTPDWLREKNIMFYINDRVHKDHEFLLQFVDTLEEFRQLGGAVSFWCDENFTFELNHFLSVARFYSSPKAVQNNKKETPTKYGNPFVSCDFGNHYMYPGNIAERKPGTYDESQRFKWGNLNRPLPGFNILPRIFEGDTIACASFEKLQNTPFIPFAISSCGAVCSAYYLAPNDVSEGDVWIDGAATKLFLELKRSDIRRLVKNIAVFLYAAEKGVMRYGSEEEYAKHHPPRFDPPARREVDNVIFFTEKKTDVDVAFVVDATRSMFHNDKNGSKMIESAKSMIRNLCAHIEKTKVDNHINSVNFGAVFFRDLAMAKFRRDSTTNKTKIAKLEVEVKANESDVFEFENSTCFIEKFLDVSAVGGCNDGPEDWVDAFSQTNRLKWRPEAVKVVVMITDSGAHGTGFNNVVYRVGASTTFERNGKTYTHESTQQSVEKDTKVKNLIDQQEHPKLIEEINKLSMKDTNFIFIAATRDAKFAFDSGLKRIYPSNLIKFYQANFAEESLEQIKMKLNKMLNEKFTSIVMSSKSHKQQAENIITSLDRAEKQVILFKEDILLKDIIADIVNLENICNETIQLIESVETFEDLIVVIRFKAPRKEYDLLKDVFNSHVSSENSLNESDIEERNMIEQINSLPLVMRNDVANFYNSIASEKNIRDKLHQFLQQQLGSDITKRTAIRKEEQERKSELVTKTENEKEKGESNSGKEENLRILIGRIINCLKDLSKEETDYIKHSESHSELISNIRFYLSPKRASEINDSNIGIRIEPISKAAQIAIQIFIDRVPEGPKEGQVFIDKSSDVILNDVYRRICESNSVSAVDILHIMFLSAMRNEEFDKDNEIICGFDDLNGIAAAINFMISRAHRQFYFSLYHQIFSMQQNASISLPILVDVNALEDDIILIKQNGNNTDFFVSLSGLSSSDVYRKIKEFSNILGSKDDDKEYEYEYEYTEEEEKENETSTLIIKNAFKLKSTIKSKFGSYGEIKRINIGEKYVEVIFGDPMTARRVVQELDGTKYKSHTLKLAVK